MSFNIEHAYTEVVLNEYINKVQNIRSSKKSAQLIYKDLLSLKQKYENDRICQKILAEDAKKLISYLINWNLQAYHKMAKMKTNPLKMFIKGMGSIHL